MPLNWVCINILVTGVEAKTGVCITYLVVMKVVELGLHHIHHLSSASYQVCITYLVRALMIQTRFASPFIVVGIVLPTSEKL